MTVTTKAHAATKDTTPVTTMAYAGTTDTLLVTTKRFRDSMSTKRWRNPIVRRSLAQLRKE